MLLRLFVMIEPEGFAVYLTEQDALAYQRDGYVLVKDVFSSREVELMLAAVESGDRVRETTRANVDADGRQSRLAIWHDLGDDIWAAASVCPRIVNAVRVLMGEEIAFYHGKVMLKEAHSGGAWEWHQDYGYWYNGGFAFPRMMSAFTALDPATRENGCLQVLRGSHRLGRLEHTVVGNQTGVDPKRIALIEPLFERVHCEMPAGSVLFFHCNLLHTSAPNDSARHRRAFIMCYNALANPQLGHENRWQACPVGADDGILRFAERAAG